MKQNDLVSLLFLQLGSVGTVSVVRSFFDMGGDSLKAGQLIAAMRKRLQVQLSVADLFSAPTIGEFLNDCLFHEYFGDRCIIFLFPCCVELVAHKVSSLKILGSPGFSTKPGHMKTPRPNFLLSPGAVLDKYATAEYSSPFLNTSFSCLLVQALPIALIYPFRRIIIWFLIAIPWVGILIYLFSFSQTQWFLFIPE